MNSANRQFVIALAAVVSLVVATWLVRGWWDRRKHYDAQVPNHREIYPLPGPSLPARIFARVAAWVGERS